MIFINLILPAAPVPEVYSTSDRNNWQRQKLEIFMGIRAWPVRGADIFTAICEPIV
jgi:hypothetical protein